MADSVAKRTPKTTAERKHLQRQRQKENDPDYQKKENERMRLLRQKKKETMSLSELNDQHSKDRIRQASCQRKRKEKEERQKLEPVKVKVYHSRQSYGKALKRGLLSLPKSPRKKAQVVLGLAEAVGVNLNESMERKLNEKTERKQKLVKKFFFEKDIVYTAPGMKDLITVCENSKKQRLSKYYLTMYLREAHSTFKAKHPAVTISYLVFCKLKPQNVLLKNATRPMQM